MHVARVLLAKAVRATDACHSGIRSQAFSSCGVSSVSSVNSFTTWQMSEGKIFKWPKSIFTELTKIVNLNLNSSNG